LLFDLTQTPINKVKQRYRVVGCKGLASLVRRSKRSLELLTNLGIFTVKKSKQKEWQHRLEKLYETVHLWINEVPEKTITSIYLFYDS